MVMGIIVSCLLGELSNATIPMCWNAGCFIEHYNSRLVTVFNPGSKGKLGSSTCCQGQGYNAT